MTSGPPTTTRTLPDGITLERVGTDDTTGSELTRVLRDGYHVGLIEHCYTTPPNWLGGRDNWQRVWVPTGCGVRSQPHRTRREALAALLAAADRHDAEQRELCGLPEPDLCEADGCRREAVVLLTTPLDPRMDAEVGRFCAGHARCQSIGCEAPATTAREHSYPAPPMLLCAGHAAAFDLPVQHPTAAWSRPLTDGSLPNVPR